MKTYIEVSFSFEGIHRWPNAPDAVKFLRDPHRHVFLVKAKKRVFHTDRDVEFIMLKREMQKSIFFAYPTTPDGTVLLDTASCESIAKSLVDHFELSSCYVYEDGENGGGVEVEE